VLRGRKPDFAAHAAVQTNYTEVVVLRCRGDDDYCVNVASLRRRRLAVLSDSTAAATADGVLDDDGVMTTTAPK